MCFADKSLCTLSLSLGRVASAGDEGLREAPVRRHPDEEESSARPGFNVALTIDASGRKQPAQKQE